MLLFCELEYEIGREPFLIAFYLLVETPNRHAIKFRNVSIEDDSLMAQK